MRTRSPATLFLTALVTAIVLAVAGLFAAGSILSAPSRRVVGEAPAWLEAETVHFASHSGAQIAAWYAAPEPRRPIIVLSHGVRGARNLIADRARFLREAGFGVLLYDAQAHGESTGNRITFGFLESRDARAAVDFARTRNPASSIGFVGPSLAGASALLGAEPLPIDAMVLEAVYPRLGRAVENRIAMRLGSILAEPLAALLLAQVEMRLGFDPYALNPIDRIADVCGPVLIIAGAQDRHTSLEESKALFDAAPEPKDLWVLGGAAHQSFHRFATREYEERVLAFFERTLSSPRRPAVRCAESLAKRRPNRISGAAESSAN